MFRIPRRWSLLSHQLTAKRLVGKLSKEPKPPKVEYHKVVQRASLRSEELLKVTAHRPFERRHFDEARSTLNYLRTKQGSNKNTVHGALDVLDRLVREIMEQEQMYRSNWLDFEYVEPFLLNWVQAWREEHEREQGIYKPMELLKKMQAIPWPANFDPDQKTAKIILAGMMEVAHKFDAPEEGEEMLQVIKTVTLEHCNLVLKAWAKSDIWEGADKEGLRAFCHSMVKVYGQTPDKVSVRILRSLLGREEALKTVESAIAGRDDAVAILAKAYFVDRAEERFPEVVANNGPVYECARAILDRHEGNVERAEKFFHEVREYLNDEDHDVLLERLVDFYADNEDYQKAEKAMLYARFEQPTAGLITSMRNQPDRIVALAQQHLHDTAMVQAAVETLSSNLQWGQAIRVIRLVRENKSDAPTRLVDALVDGIAKSGHPESGKFSYQLYQEAKELLPPDSDSFRTILQSCLRASMLREVDAMASGFVNFDSLDDAKEVLDCWGMLGTRAHARNTREQLDAIENPGIFAYNVLLYSIIMSADPTTGSQLCETYNEIKESGGEADSLCLDIIVSFCCQSQEVVDIERAQSILESLETKTKGHFELLVRGWLNVDETKRARDVLFKQIEEYNNRDDGESLRPSQELVSAITRKFLRQKRLLKAHHFVERINDLWLADYLPDPPHHFKTIRPLLDAWGMSSFPGKDVYIEDILNYFGDFTEEVEAQAELEASKHGPDPEEEKIFYEMEGLSDDEDKAMFPEAVEDAYADPLGDVELESDSDDENEEEEEDDVPDKIKRRRGHYGNMPDNAFDDSSDEESDMSDSDSNEKIKVFIPEGE